jgi:uncharacterized delta-60 repeat protein
VAGTSPTRGRARLGALLAALTAIALLSWATPMDVSASVGNFGMAVQPDGKIVVAGSLGQVDRGTPKQGPGAVLRFQRDGRLDRSFGKGGIVVSRSAGPFTALALQDDGRILLTSPIGQLSRLLPDGRFDPSFGVDGLAPAGTLSAYYPTSVAVDRDRSILVGGMTGYLNDPAEHLYGRIYRYTPNGKSSEWIGSMSPSTGQSDPKSSLNDFLIRGNGSVIAAGTVGPRPPAAAREHAALARVVPNGGGFPDAQDKPGPSFGGGVGLVESSFFPSSGAPESANDLAAQRGKLLIAGQAEYGILLARYNRGGTLDTSFGDGGAAVTAPSTVSPNAANAIFVQPSGKIVVAGSNSFRGCQVGCVSLIVARYGPNGKLDRGFGRRGIVSPPVETKGQGRPVTEIAHGAARQPGEGILVGGVVTTPTDTRLFLRRYLVSGKPDRSFGVGGRVAILPLRALRKQR